MNTIKSSEGFGLLSLTLLLPLLLTLLLGSFVLARGVRTWNQQNHLCRRMALDHQKNLSLHLQRLMALNPRAKSLRIREKIAFAKLLLAISSGVPPAIVAAKARHQFIRNKQRLHDLRQKMILSAARSEKYRFLLNFRTQMRAYDPKADYQSPPTFSPLAIEARPPKDWAPEYKPLPEFEEKQALSLNWELPFKVGGSEQPEGESWGGVFHIKCGASLRKEYFKWIPRLSKARL